MAKGKSMGLLGSSSLRSDSSRVVRRGGWTVWAVTRHPRKASNYRVTTKLKFTQGQVILVVIRHWGWTTWTLAKNAQMKVRNYCSHQRDLLKQAQLKESTYFLSRGCWRGVISKDDDDEVRTTVYPQVGVAASEYWRTFQLGSVFIVRFDHKTPPTEQHEGGGAGNRWLSRDYRSQPDPYMYTRVQRFLKMKKSPASVARRSSVQILKNVSNFLCIV